MNLSLSFSDLQSYIKKQLDNFFPDNIRIDDNTFKHCLDIALQRAEICFKHIRHPYFNRMGEAYFSHLHTDQYAMFLYLLSNTVWNEFNDDILASKVMYLNKTLHSVNCMYDTQLPEVFMFFHCVGTVIGKAKYGNYLAIYQGVTIGSHNNKSPVIGDFVSLLPHSCVVGECSIGNRVSVGVGTKLYKTNINDDHIAITDQNGILTIKPSEKLYSNVIFFC